jgi:exopolyphosphatase / guanosine-5'-triphosphate,3'-diphosphate pyrophosphatase
MPRVAAIDCGTNSIRLLVAELTPRHDGTVDLRDLHREMRIVRLGQGVDATGRLAPEAIERTRVALADYTIAARRKGVEKVRMVATSATRDASNRDEFFAMTRETLGVEAEVITGDEEARLSFTGAVGEQDPDDGPFVVVDVGGGSTELAVGTLAGGATWSESFRVGSGLLTDHYRRADPPSAAELHAMREYAHGVFEGLDLPPVGAAVAVGGSAASLRRLVGATLDGDSLQRAMQVLAAEPADAVAERLSIDRERVLLMPAGLTVLDAAGAAFGRPLLIGRGGLREGVILELAGSSIDRS